VTTDRDVALTPWFGVFRTQWMPDDRWKEIATLVDGVDEEQ